MQNDVVYMQSGKVPWYISRLRLRHGLLFRVWVLYIG